MSGKDPAKRLVQERLDALFAQLPEQERAAVAREWDTHPTAGRIVAEVMVSTLPERVRLLEER